MKRSNSLLKTAVAAAGVLHCVNKLIDSSSTTSNISKATGELYHWKHGDVFYKVSGSGSPLLLIHDLSVYSSNYEWSNILNRLSAHNKVYCIDLIGCGKSDKPALTYTNYFYVQLITDFVKDIIGEKVTVAATGLSASFVLMANKLDSSLFDSIVLINPPSISSLKEKPTDRSKFLLRFFELPVISKTLYYFLTNKENTEHYLTKKCFYNPFNIKPSMVRAYYDAAHTDHGNGKSLLASIQSHYVNADIAAALKNTDNEIILITGSHKTNRKEIIDSYTSINPSIIHKSISGSNHLPQLESPEEFTDFLVLI